MMFWFLGLNYKHKDHDEVYSLQNKKFPVDY